MGKSRKRAGPLAAVGFDMGTKSMAYARVDVTDPASGLCRLTEWGLINLETNMSRECTQRMFDLLQDGELRWIREQRVPVVVEAQPANGACKTLTHVMQLFFLKDAIAEPRPHTFSFMAPNTKLHLCERFYAEMPHDSPAARKEIAMRTTGFLLDALGVDKSLRAFYAAQAYKQRTDLADALVQTVRFLQRANDAVASFLVAQLEQSKNNDDDKKRKLQAGKRKFEDARGDPSHFDTAPFCARMVNRRAPTHDDAPIEWADGDDYENSGDGK